MTQTFHCPMTPLVITFLMKYKTAVTVYYIYSIIKPNYYTLDQWYNGIQCKKKMDFLNFPRYYELMCALRNFGLVRRCKTYFQVWILLFLGIHINVANIRKQRQQSSGFNSAILTKCLKLITRNRLSTSYQLTFKYISQYASTCVPIDTSYLYIYIRRGNAIIVV